MNIPSKNEGVIWIYGTSNPVQYYKNPGQIGEIQPKFATNMVTVDFSNVDKNRYIQSIVNTPLPIYNADTLPNGNDLLPFMQSHSGTLVPYP